MTATATLSPAKRTIVLIHGLWVTPHCWDKFRHYYESRGYEVLAPAWPGVGDDAAAMRRDPSALNGVGAEEVIGHYAEIIRSLPEPPIIMGHSYGGVITQVLIDRGYGAAGVAIDSVPPKGVYLLPLSTYLALTPAFLKPATFKGTFLFTLEQFWKVFANTLSESEVREAYESVAIPASGRAIFQAALANFMGKAPTSIDFTNSRRAPLLLIGGEKDVIMPSALNRKNFLKYRSGAVTEFKEFPGRSHYIIAETGWEEVAAHALSWAEAKSGVA
ncbi:alpha/beta hydrolase [Luteolibacter flavescens]|uniref:Alpha/beta hydrolase n=1 Tax=Luteolibacter flavescens TaxID=1859460 RepID=A0ABT3FUL5_9BACT|nr:alpha/beta hydrolase [Luteolibacter flavescens]MCW1887250.1 alpha/beta hydrolase [Luteolibacter flavescens]